MGIVAALFAIARALPQAGRVLFHRRTAGVSSATWGLSLASSLVWIIWGITFHNLPNLVANIGIGIASGTVILVLAVRGIHVGKAVLGAVGIACIAGLGAVLSHGLLDVIAVLMPSVYFLPQMIVVLKNSDVDGVSLPAWCIAFLGMLLWLVYGIGIHNIPVILPSLICMPQIGIIIGRTASLRLHPLHTAHV